MPPEILYATTDDGSRLAIVDVTNPAFTAATTDAELLAMADRFLLESKRRQQQMPTEFVESLKHSTLGRGLIAASGTFLTGLNTYLFKLGPDNLGPEAELIDRLIAASFPAFSMRLRLQDMARMQADAIVPLAAADPHRTICFISIAGGPAADTWNTLIHLQADHPHLLAHRKITIAVLDLDAQGPSFGRRAFDTLRAPGSPLNALDIHHQHLAYDWTQTDRLPEILSNLQATDTLCAISSEGGLFEYGSDEQIVANLHKLHTGTAPDAFVAGTVTRDAALVYAAHSNVRITTRPRTLEAFQQLTSQAGWTVQHVIERPMSYNLRLVKA